MYTCVLGVAVGPILAELYQMPATTQQTMAMSLVDVVHVRVHVCTHARAIGAGVGTHVSDASNFHDVWRVCMCRCACMHVCEGWHYLG